MDRMWAPWRKAYIRPSKNPGRGCLFCKVGRAPVSRDAKNLILKRSRLNFAILNLYPYNNGHVMIVPNRHLDRIEKMTDAEKLDWLELYGEVLHAIEKTLRPHGFNAGINLGRLAGAGIPKHLHLHLVPRWKGDVNFMPVIANTKVISESLTSVHKILSAELRKSPSRGRQKKRGFL